MPLFRRLLSSELEGKRDWKHCSRAPWVAMDSSNPTLDRIHYEIGCDSPSQNDAKLRYELRQEEWRRKRGLLRTEWPISFAGDAVYATSLEARSKRNPCRVIKFRHQSKLCSEIFFCRCASARAFVAGKRKKERGRRKLRAETLAAAGARGFRW